MAKKTTTERGINRTTVCTFCLNSFTQDKIWWVDMIMHRTDPNCTSRYSVPSCEKCKEDPDNTWMIVGISEEPKEKKPKKNEKAK